MNMPGPAANLMPTLFVGDLPSDCSENELRMLFEPFGAITSIRMKRGTSGRDYSNRSDDSKAFYYAFIKFDQRKSAEIAFQSMQGFFYRGRNLRVGWTSVSDDQHGGGGGSASGMGGVAPPGSAHGMVARGHTVNPQPMPPFGMSVPHARTAQVHFSYLSKQLEFIITEAFLWDVFYSFGEVVEISLKRSSCDEDMCIQNGYGFAHYPLSDAGINSALKAVSALHQVTIHQVTYDCSVSNQLKQIIAKTGGVSHVASAAATTAQLRRVAHVTGQYLGQDTNGARSPYTVPRLDCAVPPNAPYDRFDRQGRMAGGGGGGYRQDGLSMQQPQRQQPPLGFGGYQPRGQVFGNNVGSNGPYNAGRSPSFGQDGGDYYGSSPYYNVREPYPSPREPYPSPREPFMQSRGGGGGGGFDDASVSTISWAGDRSVVVDGPFDDQRSVGFGNDAASIASSHSGRGAEYSVGSGSAVGQLPYGSYGGGHGRYDAGRAGFNPSAVPFNPSSNGSVGGRSWMSNSSASSRTPSAPVNSTASLHSGARDNYLPAQDFPPNSVYDGMGRGSGGAYGKLPVGGSSSSVGSISYGSTWSAGASESYPSGVLRMPPSMENAAQHYDFSGIPGSNMQNAGFLSNVEFGQPGFGNGNAGGGGLQTRGSSVGSSPSSQSMPFPPGNDHGDKNMHLQHDDIPMRAPQYEFNSFNFKDDHTSDANSLSMLLSGVSITGTSRLASVNVTGGGASVPEQLRGTPTLSERLAQPTIDSIITMDPSPDGEATESDDPSENRYSPSNAVAGADQSTYVAVDSVNVGPPPGL